MSFINVHVIDLPYC